MERDIYALYELAYPAMKHVSAILKFCFYQLLGPILLYFMLLILFDKCIAIVVTLTGAVLVLLIQMIVKFEKLKFILCVFLVFILVVNVNCIPDSIYGI